MQIDDSPQQAHAPDSSTLHQAAHTSRLILRKSTDSLSTQLNNSLSDNTHFSTNSTTESDNRVIHDRTNKVLRKMVDGHKTNFLVEDFVGLFPV